MSVPEMWKRLFLIAVSRAFLHLSLSLVMSHTKERKTRILLLEAGNDECTDRVSSQLVPR